MILIYTILIGAVTYRIWRVLALDTITEPLRDRWAEYAYPRRRRSLPRSWWTEWLSDWMFCVWCLGFWIAGVLSFIWYGWSWELLLVWPASNVVAGWLHGILDE